MTSHSDPVMPPLAERSCTKAHAYLDELGVPSTVAPHGCSDEDLTTRIRLLQCQHEDAAPLTTLRLNAMQERLNTLIDIIQEYRKK